MRVRLEPRPRVPIVLRVMAPAAAALATIIAGAILFGALGRDPVDALYSFFLKPVLVAGGLAELLLKGGSLALIGMGLAIGFRGNVWNIGAEGQLLLGAIGAGGVALAFHGADAGWWLLPLMALAGIAAGMAWAAVPALLKTRFNANEILTSLMLTYVALQFLLHLVHGPWRDPEGFNFPESRLFEEAALLPALVEGTRLNVGILLAPVALVAGWVFLRYSYLGFQLRVAGQAPAAAAYAGFSHGRVVWISLLTSGGLAGLAGFIEVAGPVGQLNATFAPGYGFAAIIVAFLGRLHPVGVGLAALLMALMFLGGETLQIDMQLPKAVTGVFQGMLLFFVLAADALVRFRLTVEWRASGEAASDG